MSCSNCFNGCTEIVSDRCVRYTGVDIPVLGIKNGDSLSYIEQALIEFLTSTLNGIGIKPIIDPVIICNLVKNFLPTCGDLTVNDFISALIKSACALQVEVDELTASITTINGEIATIEAPYDIKTCLTGVTSTSGTHAVLQAVINTLCQLIIDLPNTYVALADIETIIANYINQQNESKGLSSIMVPYTVVEYYGPLSYFDSTGAGLINTEWEKIYLCNGLNGTPDKRGVVGVGINDGTMPGGALNNAVNPAITGNPTYSLTNGIQGLNTITLSQNQMPSHTHTALANSIVTDPGHTHSYEGQDCCSGDGNSSRHSSPSTKTTTSSFTGISVATTVVVDPIGGNLAHTNYQPGLGCYYIMYIP